MSIVVEKNTMEKAGTIVFASSCYPEPLYKELVGRQTDQQAQKFNRLLLKGFVNNAWNTHALSFHNQVSFSQCPGDFIDNGIHYSFLSTKFSGYRGWFDVVCQSYRQTKEILKKDKKAIVGCNILNAAASIGVLLAAKRFKRRAIGFITDVPEILTHGKNDINTITHNLEIRLCTDCVLLTEQMKELVHTAKKHVAVMEGLTDNDISINKSPNPISSQNEKRIMLYAGALHRRYGIVDLVEAFIKANVQDAELHVYGDGDYRQELKKICEQNSAIKYFGVVPNNEVVQAEKQADVLVNPRKSNEEFTKYSFPSKILEYMSTGVPVLMNQLPGIPKEYFDYCYAFQDETSEGFASTIQEILALPKEQLVQKGHQALLFVAQQKNCTVQVAKLLKALQLSTEAEK